MNEGARQENDSIRHNELIRVMKDLTEALRYMTPFLEAAATCGAELPKWMTLYGGRCNFQRGHNGQCGRIEMRQSTVGSGTIQAHLTASAAWSETQPSINENYS